MRALAARVDAVGGRALLVGGSVRDHLMGRPIEDWDIEVHGLPAEELERVLKKLGHVNLVGRSFGVYKLRPPGWDAAEIDVSIPRRDSKVGPGHKGIAVEGDPHLGEREAARRRDLTVNAIGIDLVAARLVDPWNGVEDLRAGRLRAVDRDTFLEDPLRALRVVQFAARLEFAVDPALVDLCREAALDELPAERVLGEWVKLMLASDRPSVGLAVARQAAILSRVFPEHADRAEDDAVVDRMAARRADAEPVGRALSWMVAAWLHADTPAAVEATCDRLGLFRHQGFDTRKLIPALVAHADDPIATDADLRWLATRVPVEDALALRGARHPEFDPEPVRARAAALGVLHEPPAPFVQGRDLQALGHPPGPAMGETLRRLYAQQLDGELQTPEQALEAARAFVDEEASDST